MELSPDPYLTSLLDSNERLLWSGKPRGGVRLRPQDALLIPFSLLWGGFAIFWETMVVRSGAPFFFALWGIPFVLVGLYLIVGRFFADAKIRNGTLYGVTNDRVIIVSGLFSRQIKSLQLRTLSEVTLAEKNDGSGTITFGPALPWNGGFSAGGAWPGYGRRNAPPAFEMIEGVKEVYNIIRSAQRHRSSEV